MPDTITLISIAIAAIAGVSAGYGLRIYLSKPKG